MNKKSYFWGFFTGIFVAVFLLATFICARIIYRNSAIEKRQQSIIDNVFMLTDEADDYGISSVLEDEDVVKKIMTIETLIDTYYINDVSEDNIVEGIYDGIMASIGDKYAAYYTSEELIELSNSTQGIYYGIGAYLMLDTKYNYPKITGIIKNSPASESELRVDDYITMVNGIDLYGYELSEAVALIKGEKGTTVTLTIVRKSTNEQFDLDIERQEVETPTVEYENLGDGIAYIQITEFDDVTVTQFAEALLEAETDGMKGLILDLRGNPGGSLTAVVDIAGQILPKGTVVYTEDKYGNQKKYTSDGNSELQVPMVVLVNGGSASASEILAGAIKDYDKGYLLGTTTFGKGIVQRVIGLIDGSAVKLTVSHYYTPLGNDIHGVGIEPDEVLEFDTGAYLVDTSKDNQKERAVEIIREQID